MPHKDRVLIVGNMTVATIHTVEFKQFMWQVCEIKKSWETTLRARNGPPVKRTPLKSKLETTHTLRRNSTSIQGKF
jgi:hypothetical protein